MTGAKSQDMEHYEGMGCDLGERHPGVCVIGGRGQTERRDLEASLKTWQGIASNAMDECRRLADALVALDTTELAALTDEEIMASEDRRKWLCGLQGRAAHDRMVRLVEQGLPTGVGRHGIDGRDEWFEQQLPCLAVSLRRNQDVTGVTAAIDAWTQVWALGRDDMPIKVIDSDLSRYGTWSIFWRISRDRAEVVRVVYGSRRTEFAGTLFAALRYAATHAWYEED